MKFYRIEWVTEWQRRQIVTIRWHRNTFLVTGHDPVMVAHGGIDQQRTDGWTKKNRKKRQWLCHSRTKDTIRRNANLRRTRRRSGGGKNRWLDWGQSGTTSDVKSGVREKGTREIGLILLLTFNLLLYIQAMKNDQEMDTIRHDLNSTSILISFSENLKISFFFLTRLICSNKMKYELLKLTNYVLFFLRKEI